jgi:lysozyme
MQLAGPGTRLIQSFEKCALRSYQDSGGVWTIGWGHTGSEVHEGMTCTVDQADTWFTADVQQAVRAVNESVHAPLTQNQFDALVAFTYNVGAGAEQHSTLVRLLNAGHVAEAANEFLKWSHVNGQVSAGLLRRRTAEQSLFLAQ